MLDLMIWGPINETFRSKFVILKEQNDLGIVMKDVRSLLFYIFLFSFIFTIVIELFPHYTSKLFAPSYSGDELDSLLIMLRLTAPYLLFNQFVLLISAILNAFDVFFVPEIAALISQCLNIVVLICFKDYLGIYSLVVSLYLSTFILMIFQLFYVKRLKIPLFSFGSYSFSGFKSFFIFALPFFVPYFFGQVNGIIEKSLASALDIGTVSMLDFARRIPDTVNTVIISVVLTLLVPKLAKSFANNDKEQFNRDFTEVYQLGLFALSIFFIFIYNGGQYLIPFLYASKLISSEEFKAISKLSILYGLVIYSTFTYTLFGMCLLAINKGKYYATFGTIAQIIVILLNITFVKYVSIWIFPISIFVAHILISMLMFRKYPFSKLEIYRVTIKYIVFVLLSSMCVFFIDTYILDKLFLFYKGGNVFSMIKIFVIETIVITCVGIILKVEELISTFKFIKKRFSKI